jgi:succinate dehydrogenase flavin-adding protein (antitoxin of CptAB toxin-antitoxin module)|tara:strand:+ start:494 stop:727 length:234 start_codon:yes stop_codon:yes gene_type:complete
MDNELLIKKLNFKSRRGMKETTFVLKKFLENFNKMNQDEKSELIELLEMNDQDLFDLIFKHKEKFISSFPNLEKFAY